MRCTVKTVTAFPVARVSLMTVVFVMVTTAAMTVLAHLLEVRQPCNPFHKVFDIHILITYYIVC